ncbi:hypothetical protein [Amycolatopsis sp. lyj-23]|uniref:hypothetical protein n=1 Tax=Amycolatopsis sp. lyj-23 TaxID=2789283 RepID=UPI0039794DF0
MKPRTIEPRIERPPLPLTEDSTQNGILNRMYISASATSRLTNPLTVGPNKVNPPGARNTFIAVTNASDCPTWMARQPPPAFHHQKATPSVCGVTWHMSAIGAPAIRITVSATRTM